MLDKRTDPWYLKVLYLLLEVFIYGMILMMASAAVFGILGLAGVEMVDDLNRPFFNLFTNFLPMLVIFSGAMYVCNNLIFKRDLSVTGFVKEGWIKDTSDGYLLAFVLIGLGFIILRFAGYLDFEGVEFEPYYFFGFFLMFIVQSAGEEVLSRSWMMPAIESRFGAWPALLITSGLFSVMHIGNPNTSTIGLINIFLAGLMLGMFFLKYRNIWFITGLHAGWNWIQATVFDFNVSGFDVPSMINFNPYGNEMISGGEFGFEGSIVSCIALGLVIGYLLFKHYDDMFGNRPEWYSVEEQVAMDDILDVD